MVASLSFDSTMQKNLVLLSLSFLLLTISGDGIEPEMGRTSRTDPLQDLLLLGDGGQPEMGRISRYWPFKTYFWRSLVIVASLILASSRTEETWSSLAFRLWSKLADYVGVIFTTWWDSTAKRCQIISLKMLLRKCFNWLSHFLWICILLVPKKTHMCIKNGQNFRLISNPWKWST